MDLAASIGKLGFRRWYERQLVEAHLWLVVCLAGLIGLFGGLEAIDPRSSGATQVLSLLFAFVAGFLAWHALMQYVGRMVLAHRVAGASTCARCATCGKFRVLRQAPVMEVACDACGNRWPIR